MITPAQLRIFWKCIDEGASVVHASRTAGFSAPSGYNIAKQQRGRELVKRKKGTPEHHWSQRSGLDKDPRNTAEAPEPVQHENLSDEAKEALADFNYFSERYFGRAPTPWRKETAERIFELYNSDEKHFAVVNAPPGVGKSALFTHDIPAWLTANHRGVRGVLGSWGMRPASAFTRRLRTTLERSALVPVSDDLIRKGLEREPSGVLAKDFGRFKPLNQGDFWTAEAFVVDQLDGRPIADKEPTWTAFGNGEILGWRVDLMIWDDLVTTKKLSSDAEQEKLHVWWDNEVEKRLEPGGLMVLQGQRLGANDLYRYCLDKIDVDDIDELDGIDPDDPNNDVPKKYHHIVFKAHYDELCEDTEGKGTKHKDHSVTTARPYPDGCLLDPRRLTFRDTRREQAANPSLYATVYQQEDTNPDQVLVPKHWIDGDDEHPGCWDKDRGAWEIPLGLEPPFIPVVSVDPSPTKSWAVQSWLIHKPSESYFLLDLYRGQLQMPEFLYGDEKRGEYSGMIEDIRKDYLHMGVKLRHVIFERNVAQRWFLQLPYVKGWARKHSITIHDQETHHRNKADPDYGITMLRPLFREGKIRLPGKQVAYGENPALSTGRRNAIKLVNEITRYSLQFGASGTDDQIMAAWFMANKARKLTRAATEESPRLNPSAPRWMRGGGMRRGARRAA